MSAPGVRIPFGPAGKTAVIMAGGGLAGAGLLLATTAVIARNRDADAPATRGEVLAMFAAAAVGVLGVAWLVTGSVKTALIVGVAIPTAANFIVKPALPGAAGSAAALAATAVGTYAVLR
jgi:uncharacterized membrane protein YgaE (UPF0421/DUF939 family)